MQASPPASAVPDARARPYRGQLALVCVTDLVVWLGAGAIYPYLPVFLNEDAHASVAMIGAIAAAYFLAVFAFSVPAGQLSDRVGRKPVMVGGTLLYAVSSLLFLTTTDPWWFVAFRVLEGAGAAAVVPAAQAFLADITTDRDRGKAFGWLTTAQYAGLIAGPALAWPLYALGGGRGAQAFYAVFLFGAVATAGAAVALWAGLREPDRAGHGRGPRVPRPALRSLLSRPVAAIILVVASANYAMGGFEVLWSVFLRDLGASLTVVGLTWVLFSAPLLLSFLGGRAADRYSRFALMVGGFAVQAGCWLLVPAIRDPVVYLLLLPIDGLAFAFALPAKQGLLVQVSPRLWLGSVQGVEQGAMQLAAFAGTLSAPLLYRSLGASFFAVAGLVALAGLIIATPTLREACQRIGRSGTTLSSAEAADAAAQAQSAAADAG